MNNEIKISEYIKNNPYSYLGYFVRGLYNLDKLIKFQFKSDINISKDFKKAAILSKREDISKYYFLSLIYEEKQRNIKFFRCFLIKNKIKIKNENFKLINSIIRKTLMNRRTKALIKISDLNNFKAKIDALDNLILFCCALINDHEDKGVYSYLYRSYLTGRRSKTIIEEIICKGDYNDILYEDNVEIFSDYIIDNNNIHMYEFIIEEELIKNINKNNYRLVEKLIENSSNKKKYELIKLYVDYCMINNHKNMKTAISISNNKIDELKVKIYLDIMAIESGKDVSYEDYIDRYYRDKVLFHKFEIDFINNIFHKGKETRVKRIYKLQLEGEAKDEKVDIIMKFEGYCQMEKMEYYTTSENYYFLPEEPAEVNVLINGNLIDYNQEFSVECVYSNEIEHHDIFSLLMCQNERDAQCERFLVYMIKDKISGLDIKKIEVINKIIDNNNIFKENTYIEVLYGLKKVLHKEKPGLEIVDRINKEIIKLDLNPKILHHRVYYEEDYDTIINQIFLSRHRGVNPQIRSILFIIKRAIKDKYYDGRVLNLCEELIYKHLIINEDIARYLYDYYNDFSIKLENKNKLENVLSSYHFDSTFFNKLILNSFINSNKFDFEFEKIFIQLYKELGYSDPVVINSMNKMIWSSKEKYSNEIIEIMFDMYEKSGDIFILEKGIYHNMLRNKLPEEKYLNDLIAFYLQYKTFSLETLWILTVAEKILKEKPEGYEEFFAEMLKREIIYFNNKKDYFKYKILENDEEHNVLLKEKVNCAVINMGYSMYFYDEEGEKITRVMLNMNKHKIIEWYDLVKDTEFKKFVEEYCIQNNIFNEMIILQHIKTNGNKAFDGYETLIRKFIYGDIKKAEKYLREYITLLTNESLDKNKVSVKVFALFRELADENLQKAIELFKFLQSYLNKYGMLNDELKDYALCLIYKGHEKSIFKDMYILFDKVYDMFHEKELQVALLAYINSLNKIESEEKVILKIVMLYHNTSFGEKIADAIISSKELKKNINFVFEIFKISKKDRIKFSIYTGINTPKSCSLEVVEFIIKNNFKKTEKMIEFLKMCKKNRCIYNLIFDRAEEYFIKDREFSKILLNLVSYGIPRGYDILNVINRDEIIFERYNIYRPEKNNDLILRLINLEELFRETRIPCITVQSQYMKLFEDYLKFKGIEQYEKDKYCYKFHKITIASQENSKNPYLIMEEILNILDFQTMMIYCLGKFIDESGLENLVIINHNGKRAIIAIGINGKNLNDYKRKKDDKIVGVCLNLLKKRLSQPEFNKTISNRLISDLENERSIDALRNNINKIMIEAKNGKGKLNELIQVINEERYLKLISRTFESKFKDNMINEIRDKNVNFDKKVEIIKQFYSPIKVDAIRFLDFLKKDGLGARKVKDDTIRVIKEFMRNSYKAGFFTREQIREVVYSLKFLSKENIDSIEYFLEESQSKKVDQMVKELEVNSILNKDKDNYKEKNKSNSKKKNNDNESDSSKKKTKGEEGMGYKGKRKENNK